MMTDRADEVAAADEDENERPAGSERVTPSADDAPVTDTFDLLSDETRVEIVRTLADVSNESLRFSELRSRAGVRDGGRFNYHLQKLRGRLVSKTENGYVLTDEGERVATLV